MRKGFVQELVNLGQELSDEQDKAHDLWTWLPSYQVAQKNHGDYASEFSPTPKDIMIEASMYISYLKDCTGPNSANRQYTPEETEWFTKCSCGDDHVGE